MISTNDVAQIVTDLELAMLALSQGGRIARIWKASPELTAEIAQVRRSIRCASEILENLPAESLETLPVTLRR